MSNRFTLPVLACALLSSPALAQFTPAPTRYTLTQVNSPAGPSVTVTIYRDGPLAVFDYADTGTRGLTDVAHGRTFSWDPKQANPECDAGTFSGDWGDPFGGAFTGELAKLRVKEVGTEVVNGIRTRVLEVQNPQAPAGTPPFRMWRDVTYGEVVKLVGPNGTGAVATLTEIRSLQVGPPPAAVFALPPSCARLGARPATPPPTSPPPPSEAEAIAAATGDRRNGAYLRGTTGPGTTESCAVLLSVVQRKTLAPITVPFRLGVDPRLDLQDPPHYEIGGTPIFKGGGLHDVTDPMKDGVVRLEGLAPVFDVEVVYGTKGAGGFTSGGGAHSAYIYKQCFGRSTSSLLVVVDGNHLSTPAEWLWRK